MRFLLTAALLIFVGYNRLEAQEITGLVVSDHKPLESVTVDLFDDNDSLHSSVLTDRKGHFLLKNTIANSRLKVEIKYLGLASAVRILNVGDSRNLGKIDLASSVMQLEEVSINGSINQTIIDGNKRIYLLDQKDFIKNSTADIAVNKVPGLVYSEGLGFKVDGVQNATLYVDGVKTEVNQLKFIDVEDIIKIEVTNTPSTRFDVENNFAIVNIVLKKDTPSFFKGKVSAVKGTLLERTGVLPSLALKKGNWLLKTNFGISQYNQSTETDVSRDLVGIDYRQLSIRHTEIQQNEATIYFKYNIDTLTTFLVRGDYFGYGLKGNTDGRIFNNGEISNFSNDARDAYSITTIDGVFEKSIANHTILVKTMYSNYRKGDKFDLSGTESYQGDIRSNLSDLALETNFGSTYIGSRNVEQNSGFKMTDRSFKFGDDQVRLKQLNFGIYTDWSFKLTKTFDLTPGIYLDISENTLGVFTRSYVTFLPSLSFGLGMTKIGRLGFSYVTKVQRPTPMDLNEAVIAIDPTTFEVGNSDLRQSYTNSFNFSLSKPYKKNFFSTRVMYSINNNSIFNDITNNNDTLYYVKSNIGKIQRLGINIGHDFFIRKGFNIYTSSGLSYNELESGGSQNNYNSGFGFLATLNVTALLFKKIQTSALFDYNSRRYDLYSVTEERPFTNISMATNFFKNRLNVRATYVDIFKINAKRHLQYNLPGLNQLVVQNRNFSNINLTITYSFGKKFSDSISQSTITHDDLELR